MLRTLRVGAGPRLVAVETQPGTRLCLDQALGAAQPDPPSAPCSSTQGFVELIASLPWSGFGSATGADLRIDHRPRDQPKLADSTRICGQDGACLHEAVWGLAGNSPKAKPFRFACRVSGGRSRTPAEWAALAKRAEALGYATFAVADHLATQYAPMTLLQHAADHTSRIRLATLVLDNDFRNPIVLAKVAESASLDLLSGGRFELGLGAGWLLEEYCQAGLAFQDGPTRAAQLEAAVHLLKALFSETPASLSGRFYTVHELDGRPKPHQRPLAMP